MSAYETIESFVEQTDEDIYRVVVPADDWDEVKRQATTHDNGGFDIETVVSGVKVVWSNTISQPKAEIKLND